MIPVFSKSTRDGFTLIEVVLALGVFLVSVLALIGLLAPMLKSVDEIEKIDEMTSVVNTVTSFLHSSPEIALSPKTRFQSIYEAVEPDDSGIGEATIFVYRYYFVNNAGTQQVRLEVGFSDAEEDYIGADAIVNEPDLNPADFSEAAGPIYRVVLSASSIVPTASRSGTRGTNTGVYTLSQPYATYPEGSLAMEARIFAEDPPGPDGDPPADTDLTILNATEPDFTFNVAIVR